MMISKTSKHAIPISHVPHFANLKLPFSILYFSALIGFASVYASDELYYKISPSCQKSSSCSSNAITEFSFQRNCQCDELCSKFGDCCKDSKYYIPSELVTCIEVGNWNTLGRSLVNAYYMIKKCPPSWVDQETLNKCENYLETIKEEPILGHPITSRTTNMTYVNYHCAKCNNDLRISTMIRWKLGVMCAEEVKTIPDIDFVLETAVIDEKGYIKPKFNVTFQSCKLFVRRPAEYLRRCHKNLKEHCLDSWKNETVRLLCESYTSIVFYSKSKPYRNPHCAICNKRQEKSLYCEKEDRVPESDFPMLFDGGVSDSGTGVGRTRICPNKDEAYDPLAKKCRNIIRSMVTGDRISDNQNCHGENTCQFYNCTKFVLGKDEYLINDDFSATDLATGKIYKTGEYEINAGGHMEICAEYEVTRQKFSSVMRIVTFIGLAVSIIGIILHLLAFAINSALRNLSGNNLASLCVALILAYVSFIVGLLVQVGGITCKIAAVFTYYSFMASFSWILIMAYDVWKTLRMSTVHLRVVSRERRWCVFIVYSGISWLVIPGVLVAVALITQNNSANLSYWPGFGAHNCWFGNRLALLVFFMVPVGIVMILNIILYMASAYMICNTNVTTSNKTSDSHRNYKLFARLAILMGLTWVTGFLAHYLNVDAIWFVFIFLNAFQGLFIFIAFTMTARVRKGIRSQVSGDSKSGTEEETTLCWSWKGPSYMQTQSTT